MTQGTHEGIVREVLAAMVRNDLDSTRPLYHPDVLYRLEAYQKTIRGRDEFLAFIGGYYGRVANFRSDVHRVVASGDTVVVEGRESYDVGGAHVDFPFVSWVVFRDGKIAEWSDWFDSRLVGKQLKAGAAGKA